MHLSRKPSRIFYGWWVVVAVFLLGLYTSGTLVFGFTAVFEPIVAEFGWSYAQIALAASLRGMETGLLAPVLGVAVDRWGPRRLMIGGVVITCLGLLLLSQTRSLATFYIAFALVAMGISPFGGTVLVAAVANWFRRRLGTVAGIQSAGWGFGGLMVPLVVVLIDQLGWRAAMVAIALGLLAIGLPLSMLARHRPEQYDYLPDGEAVAPALPGAAQPPVQTFEVNMSVKQALGSREFWLISLVLLTQFVAATSVVTHVMPYLSSVGVSRAAAGLVATAIPVLSIGSRFGSGWLGDKYGRKRITIGALAATSLGMFLFAFIAGGGAWLIAPFLALFGIGFGGCATMRGVLTMEYFGRKNFGTVLGMITGVMMLGGIAGPPVAGWVYDTWGSYRAIWLLYGALVAVGAFALAVMPTAEPRRAGG